MSVQRLTLYSENRRRSQRKEQRKVTRLRLRKLAFLSEKDEHEDGDSDDDTRADIIEEDVQDQEPSQPVSKGRSRSREKPGAAKTKTTSQGEPQSILEDHVQT